MFDSSIKEASYINIALAYLLLETTSERLSEEEFLLNCWDRFCIQGFGHAYGIRIIVKLGDVTYQTELLEKLGDIRKNRTALGGPGLMVQTDGIWLDIST